MIWLYRCPWWSTTSQSLQLGSEFWPEYVLQSLCDSIQPVMTYSCLSKLHSTLSIGMFQPYCLQITFLVVLRIRHHWAFSFHFCEVKICQNMLKITTLNEEEEEIWAKQQTENTSCAWTPKITWLSNIILILISSKATSLNHFSCHMLGLVPVWSSSRVWGLVT